MVRIRRPHVLTAIALGVALTLSACGGGGTTADPTESPTTAPVVDPNAVPASLVGMHVVGVEGGAWPSAPFGALRLWDNGTGWSQIELSKGEFTWDNLESAVQNAQDKGLADIMLVLGTTPEWAASKITEPVYPPYPGANSAPKNMSDWDDYVTAVVTRYKGRISAYQIWNEANLKDFYNGTPEEMAELTQRAHTIIKQVDPDALVVAASPALRLANAFDRFYPAYVSALGEADWPVDVFAIHTYPDANGDPSARGAFIEAARAVLADAGAPDLPLWDTELNYGLAGPGPERPKQDIKGERAAGWIVRTFIDDLRYNIDRSYWYIWTQQPYDLLGIQAYPGSDGEQGFFALENWVVGATFQGCEESADVVTCDFSRDGANWTVAWAQTGEATFTAPAGTQLVCDPLAQCQEVLPGESVTLTEVPVRFYLQAES